METVKSLRNKSSQDFGHVALDKQCKTGLVRNSPVWVYRVYHLVCIFWMHYYPVVGLGRVGGWGAWARVAMGVMENVGGMSGISAGLTLVMGMCVDQV